MFKTYERWSPARAIHTVILANAVMKISVLHECKLIWYDLCLCHRGGKCNWYHETSCDNQWCLCSLWPPAVLKSSYKSTPSPDDWCVLNGMLLLVIADKSRRGVGLWTSSNNGVKVQGHAPSMSCGKRMPSMFLSSRYRFFKGPTQEKGASFTLVFSVVQSLRFKQDFVLFSVFQEPISGCFSFQRGFFSWSSKSTCQILAWPTFLQLCLLLELCGMARLWLLSSSGSYFRLCSFYCLWERWV